MNRSTALVLLIVSAIAFSALYFDRMRTIRLMKADQDKSAAKMILMAAVVYGLDDNTVFHKFSASKVVEAARANGIKVNDAIGSEIPLHFGYLAGYEPQADKSIMARIRHGKNWVLATSSGFG
jgi:hypothetical protein